MIRIALFLIFFVTFTPLSASQARHALVIGNSAYAQGNELKNPVNDARSMETILKSKGFRVTTHINANKRTMKKAIQKFSKNLDKNSVGLFYFAGHGLEVRGRNYLIPIGADIASEADVEFEAIDAGRILSNFEVANNGLNMLILDACRDNPYGRSFRAYNSRGLKPMRPATGALVLYATEPGSVAADGEGGNGLFTMHLIQSINEPGLKIEEVFKKTAVNVNQASSRTQTPYIEGVILGDFYFTPAAPNDGGLSSPPAQPTAGKRVLSIKTEPVGALVRLDGALVGPSPTRIPGLKVNTSYLLSAEKEGYKSKSEKIFLSAIAKPREIFFSLDQENQPSEIYPFTITTVPNHARVRILNIVPKYRDGMKLEPGAYKVEVTAPNFRKKIEVVVHRGQRTLHNIVLEKEVSEIGKKLHKDAQENVGSSFSKSTRDGSNARIREDYKKAFNLLKKGDYGAGHKAFSDFLKRYQEPKYSGNAQYWMAEASYMTREFELSIEEFKAVINNFPGHPKIPDAMLKLGYANYELGRFDAATVVLNKLRSLYPETPAGRLAGKRLERMKREGYLSSGNDPGQLNDAKMELQISVVQFDTSKLRKDPKHDVAEVITNDLNRSGIFRVLNKLSYPELPHYSKEVNYSEWRSLKQKYLVIGRIVEKGDGLLNVQYQLLDVFNQKQLQGYSFHIKTYNLRTTAHEISDLIFEKITGIRGAFNTRIAYVAVTADPSRKFVLQVADSDGFNPQTLLESDQPILSPNFSPDGNSMAYESFENKRSEIFIQHLPTARRVKASGFDGVNESPGWSPDGEKLALILSKDGSTDVYSMDVDTKKLKRITNDLAVDSAPAWSRDGGSIYFLSDRSGVGQIYRFGLGGGVEQVTSFSKGIESFVLHPEKDFIFVVSQNDNDSYVLRKCDLHGQVVKTLKSDLQHPTNISIAPNGELMIFSDVGQDGDREVLRILAANANSLHTIFDKAGNLTYPVWGPHKLKGSAN